jgi:hypothetical protein
MWMRRGCAGASLSELFDEKTGTRRRRLSSRKQCARLANSERGREREREREDLFFTLILCTHGMMHT